MSAPALDSDFEREAAVLEDYGVDWVTDSADVLRRAYDATRALLKDDVEPGCEITGFDWDGLSGLTFRPASVTSGTAILYFHGGSWCVGSPETHRVPCAFLAVETDCVVHSVDYRLAPEHKFPAQRDDGLRAVAALLDSGAERIVLAGDSAGAAVAFWTDAALPPDQRAKIAGILGIYGAYGVIPAEDDAVEDDTGLSSASILAAYARMGSVETLRASQGFNIPDSVLATGAPVLLSVGAPDPLLPDTLLLAKRLEDVGRRATLDMRDSLGHGYAEYIARVPAARAAMGNAAEWIKSLV